MRIAPARRGAARPPKSASRSASSPACPTFPPRARACARSSARALTRGDRIIAPSAYAANPLIEQFDIPRERVVVIPRSVDTELYDADAVEPDRIGALRESWGVEPSKPIVLVPGRVAPWNGQDVVVEAARALLEHGWQDIRFVFAGEDRSHRRYGRSVAKRAQELGVDKLIRLAGHCRDMPAAYAAANIVVVAALEPPLIGRVVAEAQAMGRPVITTMVGVLPENVAVPPLVPEELRTGWVVARATRSSLPMRSRARCLSMRPIIAGWRRARANSPNTCFRRRALRRRRARSIPRC